jgi:hypothetical protein
VAKRGRKPNREQYGQVVALYAAGLLQREIAARLGVTRQRVSQILVAAGIRSPCGFENLPPERRRRLASLGGQAVHALGVAREFTPEEAAAAGAKGGRAAHARGTAHVFTTETGRAAGRKSARLRYGKRQAGAKAKDEAARAEGDGAEPSVAQPAKRGQMGQGRMKPGGRHARSRVGPGPGRCGRLPPRAG